LKASVLGAEPFCVGSMASVEVAAAAAAYGTDWVALSGAAL